MATVSSPYTDSCSRAVCGLHCRSHFTLGCDVNETTGKSSSSGRRVSSFKFSSNNPTIKEKKVSLAPKWLVLIAACAKLQRGQGRISRRTDISCNSGGVRHTVRFSHQRPLDFVGWVCALVRRDVRTEMRREKYRRKAFVHSASYISSKTTDVNATRVINRLSATQAGSQGEIPLQGASLFLFHSHNCSCNRMQRSESPNACAVALRKGSL